MRNSTAGARRWNKDRYCVSEPDSYPIELFTQSPACRQGIQGHNYVPINFLVVFIRGKDCNSTMQCCHDEEHDDNVDEERKDVEEEE